MSTQNWLLELRSKKIGTSEILARNPKLSKASFGYRSYGRRVVSNNHKPTSFTKRCKRFVTLFLPLGKSASLSHRKTQERSTSRRLLYERFLRYRLGLESPATIQYERTFGNRSTHSAHRRGVSEENIAPNDQTRMNHNQQTDQIRALFARLPRSLVW